MSKIRDFTTSYNQKNIVGPVSQSGGVPTGAIIESGSNANGRYVKYADGTLTCYSATATLSTGGVLVPYPVPFVGTIPRPVVSAEAGVAIIATTTAQGFSNFTLHAYNITGQNVITGVAWYVIGRWY